MSAKNIFKLIKDKEIEFVDLRFTDPRGKLQHLTMDVTIVDDEMLEKGVFFDGSCKKS
jgi:glutamine synthetase